ncbi:hypothetical protein SAMN05216286_2807 [Kosakonia oryzae]|uniref:Uncharacterized protein n=1 Tax=Kosakonia oryzae TaxID=497725 RepID=A0AA94H4I0_9ENTR|nr:hypothetical protein SAMN05216286_2807 [Kosakonia oryzae]
MASDFLCSPLFYLSRKMPAAANAGLLPCVKCTDTGDSYVWKKQERGRDVPGRPGALLFADVQPGAGQRVLALNRRFIDALERHAIKFQRITFVVERVNIPFLRHVI